MSLFGYMRAPSLLFTALEESMAFSCKARWVQSRENLDCTDRPVGIARNAYYRYFPHPPGIEIAVSCSFQFCDVRGGQLRLSTMRTFQFIVQDLWLQVSGFRFPVPWRRFEYTNLP